MEKQKAYLMVLEGDLRLDIPAEVVGVVFVTPPGLEARACYHVRFDRGTEDFIPISGIPGIKIISEEDVKSGKYQE